MEKALGSSTLRANILADQASAYMTHQDFGSAVGGYRKALEIYKVDLTSPKSRGLYCNTMLQFAYLYTNVRDVDSAISTLQELIARGERFEDRNVSPLKEFLENAAQGVEELIASKVT